MKEQEKKPIVKYHNDLNKITFRGFGSVDFDFFMSLCSKMKDVKGNEVTISFSEFMKLSGYSSKKGTDRFIRELKSMNYKQLLSSGEVTKGNKIRQFVLFTEFLIDSDDETITAKVNADYKYILQELTRSFTRFELEEFVSLDSKYSKTLYRLLKQFRTTGIYRVNLEEFKRLFGVPKSYTNMRIQDKIIKPAVAALGKSFDNLECKTLYERKPGRPVKGFEFSFTPEQIPKLPGKEPAAAADRNQKKGKRNSFHNFEQRNYDFNELEKALLEKQRKQK